MAKVASEPIFTQPSSNVHRSGSAQFPAMRQQLLNLPCASAAFVFATAPTGVEYSEGTCCAPDTGSGVVRAQIFGLALDFVDLANLRECKLSQLSLVGYPNIHIELFYRTGPSSDYIYTTTANIGNEVTCREVVAPKHAACIAPLAKPARDSAFVLRDLQAPYKKNESSVTLHQAACELYTVRPYRRDCHANSSHSSTTCWINQPEP